MTFWERLLSRFRLGQNPAHIALGKRGEIVARRHLMSNGLKFLTANYRTPRGEIDLIFRDGDCLVFVEVKTRSSEDWARPADSVNAEKKRRLSLVALDYLKRIGNPAVPIRFDVVEVVFNHGSEPTVRHLPNAFGLSSPYRYG